MGPMYLIHGKKKGPPHTIEKISNMKFLFVFDFFIEKKYDLKKSNQYVRANSPNHSFLQKCKHMI